MRALYTLRVRPGVAVPVPEDTPSLEIEGILVGWRTDEENNLAKVVLEFSNLVIAFTDEGRIDPAPVELQKRAFRLASYVANRIYLQTFIDVVDPEQVLLCAPEVFPENMNEELMFKSTPRRMWSSLRGAWSVREVFDPAPYALGFPHSAAYGYYCDALRAISPFQKFELLYKVVEYFFPEESASLDSAVSVRMASSGMTLPTHEFTKLRVLRNRIVHPRAHHGHVHSERFDDVAEVSAGVQKLQRIVVMLIGSPC